MVKKKRAYSGEIEEFIPRRFHVLSHLSNGGTSEIYKAIDTVDNSKVVIKILPSDYAAASQQEGEKPFGIARREIEQASEFITQEGKFLEACHHPNIIRQHGYNLESRRPYIILDYLENKTLDKIILLRKRYFSIKETLNIVAQICTALSYVHNKGFVYCDLKPNNIIYRQKKLTLIDFGFVKPINMLVNGGSIGYLAPEILDGEHYEAKATPALDIYALGILLYELLTRQHPFLSQSSLDRKDRYSIDRKILANIYAIPKSASDLNPSLPKGFDAILLRCIEKHPRDRYQSMDSLFQEFSQEAGRFI